MASFSIAYNKTERNEGGYVNDPQDAGGETWKGIARKKNPNWEGWALVDFHRNNPHFPGCLKDDEKLEFSVRKFYKQLYWDRMRGDEINKQEIANPIYDSCVNMGVNAAIKLSQRSLEITETGVMDDVTLSKLNT